MRVWPPSGRRPGSVGLGAHASISPHKMTGDSLVDLDVGAVRGFHKTEATANEGPPGTEQLGASQEVAEDLLGLDQQRQSTTEGRCCVCM